MNIIIANKVQYRANHDNLALFTKAIITLQAKSPERKAERKPKNRGKPATEEATNSPPTIWRKVSPKIGIKTIKKENCAITERLTPVISPVEMVVPERESPGTTATA